VPDELRERADRLGLVDEDGQAFALKRARRSPAARR